MRSEYLDEYKQTPHKATNQIASVMLYRTHDFIGIYCYLS